jgi:hypothetical protein
VSDFVLPDGEPPALYVRLVPTEQQASSPGVLALETLEHGAYYAGKVGVTPTVARWHGKKRRFVFGQFSLGQQRLRSLAHIADNDRGTEERFIPLSKPEPKDSYRVSDYAFETAG